MSTLFQIIARLRVALVALLFGLTAAAISFAPALVQADDAPPAAAADAGHETVSNPYGLDAVWKSGIIDQSVLVLMLIMSAGTWYVMVVKLIDQTKLFANAKDANKKFWTAASVKDGVAQLKKGSPFWYIADRGYAASLHHEGTMLDQIDRPTWISLSLSRAVDDIQSNLQGGLAVLATVGSTAPFVGLFGTVVGIYNALIAIGISGQASIDKVAGPVGQALIMTAIGLFVAVPAVMGYNWLVRRNKIAMERVRTFSSDLHSVLCAGTRIGEQSSAEVA